MDLSSTGRILEVSRCYWLIYPPRQAFAWRNERLRFECPGVAHFQEEPGKRHGRFETRDVYCTSDLSCLGALASDWKNLRSLILVCSTRTTSDRTQPETRFYISSLPAENPEKLANAIRSHWSVENKVHWVLDVAFNEDASRVRKNNGPQNLTTLRHIAVNLLKQEKSTKLGIKNKRLSAGWDNDYLLQVLGLTRPAEPQADEVNVA